MDHFQPCTPRAVDRYQSVQINGDNAEQLASHLRQCTYLGGTEFPLVFTFVGKRRDGRSGVLTARVGDWLVWKQHPKKAVDAYTVMVLSHPEYHEMFKPLAEVEA